MLSGKASAKSLLGSAVDALQQMNLYLAMRPKTFPSLASAIDWQ